MSREGDWMCSSCQHLNFKKRDSCQRCRCSKFGCGSDVSSYTINRTEELAGDWYCNAVSCGAHNYASRTSCYRCGATKDSCGYDGTEPPGWKSGDWICSRFGCGKHNYASRMECYKCQTPRGYGSAI